MQKESPLFNIERQPKLYIDLPSNGRYYKEGTLEKATELPVYSMTAADEIAVKTPDALYTGSATVSVIQRCIPAIKDVWSMPVTDIDTCLAAIRLASYGPSITLNRTCEKCQERNEYEVILQDVIDYFSNITFRAELTHDNFDFEFRPLTYRELTQIQKNSMDLQRKIVQYIPTIKDENEKASELQKIYQQINEVRLNGIISTILGVKTPNGEIESDLTIIKSWILDSDKEFFNKVVEVFTKNREAFSIPEREYKCSCGHTGKITPDLDYSNFFAQR